MDLDSVTESLDDDIREATDSEIVFLYTVTRETFTNVTKHMNQKTVNFFLSVLYNKLITEDEEGDEDTDEEGHCGGSPIVPNSIESSGSIQESVEDASAHASCSVIRSAFDGIIACLGKGEIDREHLVRNVLCRLEVDFPYLKYLKAAQQDGAVPSAGIEPNFQNLPKTLQQHALSFLGDAHDLLHCERTCKAIQDALKDDRTWQAGSKGFENTYNVTFRELACVVKAVRLTRKLQKESYSSIIHANLASQQWERMVECLEDVVTHDSFILRGDTSAVLLELVEASAIDLIRRATLHAIKSCLAGYPELSRNDIISAAVAVSEDMKTPVWAMNEFSIFMHIQHGKLFAENDERFRIVRRLAFSAGAIKIANDVYDFVWAIVARQLFELTTLASTEAALSNRVHERGELKKLFVGQQIRDFPPHSAALGGCGCGCPRIRHILVPRQIEQAAKRLLLPKHKVYGDPWIADGAEEEMQERREAEAQYEFVDYDGGEEYCESDAETNAS